MQRNYVYPLSHLLSHFSLSIYKYAYYFLFWIIWEAVNEMPLYWCLSPKNKEILLHNCSIIIKFRILALRQYYYLIHSLWQISLPVPPTPLKKNNPESRSAFSCHFFFVPFNPKQFLSFFFFFVIYDPDILKRLDQLFGDCPSVCICLWHVYF